MKLKNCAQFMKMKVSLADEMPNVRVETKTRYIDRV